MRQIQNFVLASGSPRRKRLLEDAGLVFRVVEAPPEVEENAAPSTFAGARAEAEYRALAKARCVAAAYPDAWVLGADTVVVLDGNVLGKPSGRDDARRMLRMLSSRTHEVITGFVLLGADSRDEDAVVTRVGFRELDEATIGRYVESGEPMGKAGAYAIQGRGGSLVDRVEGSYTNVVGIPVPEVLGVLTRRGVVESSASLPDDGKTKVKNAFG